MQLYLWISLGVIWLIQAIRVGRLTFLYAAGTGRDWFRFAMAALVAVGWPIFWLISVVRRISGSGN